LKSKVIGTLFDNRVCEVAMNLFFIRLYILVLVVSSFLGACSKMKFSKEKVVPPQGCVANQDQGCDFEYDIFVGGGMVDILFVDDNSGSMSFEQRKMGERFPNMLKQLDERMLDYRIGIITTDLSSGDNLPRSINKNGELQDGKLIQFQSGMKYLEPNIPGKNTLFLNTIKRPETLACDQFLQNTLVYNVDRNSPQYLRDYYDNCPSGDERAIAAAFRLVNYNQDNFIRKEAHLAVVIISDENNRSFGVDDGKSKYALTALDKPENFVDLVKLKYGSLKSLAVHSVVVPTNDSLCLNDQNNQIGNLIKGNYGTSYEHLSDLTSGVKGTVCAGDYGTQMGRIGAAIVKQVETFELHCANPVNLQVTFIPSSAANTYTLEGKKLRFARALDPSSRVHFKYACP
jgi:hypothetical protein